MRYAPARPVPDRAAALSAQPTRRDNPRRLTSRFCDLTAPRTNQWARAERNHQPCRAERSTVSAGGPEIDGTRVIATDGNRGESPSRDGHAVGNRRNLLHYHQAIRRRWAMAITCPTNPCSVDLKPGGAAIAGVSPPVPFGRNSPILSSSPPAMHRAASNPWVAAPLSRPSPTERPSNTGPWEDPPRICSRFRTLLEHSGRSHTIRAYA
jgi:hypothetical protein